MLDNQLHSKYGYNSMEMFGMVVITGLTNFTAIPALIVIYKQRMTFQFYMSIFTVLTSFMYHMLESIDCEKFILTEGSWHRLDNIGSIVCFQMLAINIADLRNPNLENKLNYLSLFIALMAQAKAPWELPYTVVPILMILVLCIVINIWRQRLPQLIMKNVYKGISIMMIAVYFFSKSQNEHADYLRFNHGMWHCCIGLMSFYIWQSKNEEQYNWNNFWKKSRILPSDSYYKDN